MMKHLAVLAALGAFSVVVRAGADIAGATNDGRMEHVERRLPHVADAGHAHEEAFAFGRRGEAAKADRTIRIKALDTMRYDRNRITVRAGETVRFIVTNAGKFRHELVIGDSAEQHEHEQEMQRMHGMAMHDDANGVSLAPGETKTIVWRFDGAGTVELACHEPGHYAAGMISEVIVGR